MLGFVTPAEVSKSFTVSKFARKGRCDRRPATALKLIAAPGDIRGPPGQRRAIARTSEDLGMI